MWQQSLWMAVFSRGGLKCAEFFLLYVHQGGLLLITFDRPLFCGKKGPSSFDNALLMSTMPCASNLSMNGHEKPCQRIDLLSVLIHVNYKQSHFCHDGDQQGFQKHDNILSRFKRVLTFSNDIEEETS